MTHRLSCYTIRRPVKVEPGILRHAGDGKGAGIFAQLNRIAGAGEGRDVGVVEVGEGNPAAVRAWDDIARVLHREVRPLVGSVEVDAMVRLRESTAGLEVDPIARFAEAGLRA